MEFRLVYDGPLPGSGNAKRHAQEKHAIRKVFHKQLAQLWDIVPSLEMRKRPYSVPNIAAGAPLRTLGPTWKKCPSILDELGSNFSRCGYRFVPLVSKRLWLACDLDILLLRRDMPGVSLVHSGGDIDNRIKTLLDALQIPDSCQQVKGYQKDADEDPFFCLVENDSLIDGFTITTDHLLTPMNSDPSDVKLVIRVRVKPTTFEYENIDFV